MEQDVVSVNNSSIPQNSLLNNDDTAGNYTFIKVIGNGAFGSIYRCEDRVNNRTVAVKTINMKTVNTKNLSEEAVYREITLLKQLSHTGRVPQFYSAFREMWGIGLSNIVDTLFIVMELIPGVTLTKHLEFNIASKVSPSSDEVWTIMSEIVSAVKCIHLAGVAHRDLKPCNIMWNRMESKATLIDFGLGTSIYTPTFNPQSGTIIYMPPEYLNGGGDVSFSSAMKHDVWSVGVLMYQITNAGLHPMGDVSSYLSCDIIKSSYKADFSECSGELHTFQRVVNFLLDWMLTADPQDRPTMEDIYIYMNYEDEGILVSGLMGNKRAKRYDILESLRKRGIYHYPTSPLPHLAQLLELRQSGIRHVRRRTWWQRLLFLH